MPIIHWTWFEFKDLNTNRTKGIIEHGIKILQMQVELDWRDMCAN